MKIIISGDDEKFVLEQVKAGRFSSAESVVVKALLMMRLTGKIEDEVERLEKEFDPEWLKREIAAAVAQADRGEVEELDADAVWAEVEQRYRNRRS